MQVYCNPINSYSCMVCCSMCKHFYKPHSSVTQISAENLDYRNLALYNKSKKKKNLMDRLNLDSVQMKAILFVPYIVMNCHLYDI